METVLIVSYCERSMWHLRPHASKPRISLYWPILWCCNAPSVPPTPHPVVPPPPPPPLCCKIVNSYRDRAPRFRHPCNCHRFWCLRAAVLVTVVTFSPSRSRCVSEVPTVIEIGMVLIAICNGRFFSNFVLLTHLKSTHSRRDESGPHLV